MKHQLLSILTLTLLTAGGGMMALASDSGSIGRRFHRETSFNNMGLVGDNPQWGPRTPLYKTYETADKVKLPSPVVPGMTLDEVIQRRRSIRSFSTAPMTLGQLTGVLYLAAGLTHSVNGYDMRTAPSGGALYPIDLYIVAHSVDSLESGLYHYHVPDSSLELIEEGDFASRIHDASHKQGSVGRSPVTLLLTARFARSTQKYADRGYRYTYMECGSICQNIYLAVEAFDLGTVVVGGFNDKATNDLLGIDGVSEAALMIMPVGIPAEE